jgi:hypothetical protein
MAALFAGAMPSASRMPSLLTMTSNSQPRCGALERNGEKTASDIPCFDRVGWQFSGATGDWEVVLGLEVHAQVNSNSKLFSGASTEFGGAPNAHVSLVDAAMPGMLPVINKECVAQAIRTGLGLKAQINLRSVFDRKNYFYPDLPQGYQISQFKFPIVGEGEVEIEVDGETKNVGIERLHLEQDAGKSIHDQHPDYSYVDLNRSGVALMEIVSKPDMRSAEGSQAYVTKLRPSCVIWKRATVTWTKATCAPTSTSRCEGPAMNWAPAARSRTSTRSASSVRRSSTKPAARSASSRTAARSTRKPACSIPKRQDALHALQGRSSRLSLLPRSRSAAARIRTGLRRRTGQGPARATRRKEAPLHG